jgi:hypothetical protein
MNESEMEMWKEKNRRELAQYNAEVMSTLEVFKSVISAGQNALKSVILINGGAAVALLAFIGSIWNESIDDIAIKKLLISMAIFVVGVLLGGIAAGLTYLVQLSYNHQKNKLGLIFNIITNILVSISYITFVIASIIAFVAFWFRLT